MPDFAPNVIPITHLRDGLSRTYVAVATTCDPTAEQERKLPDQIAEAWTAVPGGKARGA